MEDENNEIKLCNDRKMIIKSISDVYVMEFNSIYRILLEEECCNKAKLPPIERIEINQINRENKPPSHIHPFRKLLLDQLTELINQLKLPIEPSKIPSSLVPFTENDIEYYSLSNISHLLSVFKYLLSLSLSLSSSSFDLNIYNQFVDFIKEIINERKKYEQLTIEYIHIIVIFISFENKSNSFLYNLQCQLYTCCRTIEYKNKEIENDDISNIMTKLQKLYELYEISRIENDDKEKIEDSNSNRNCMKKQFEEINNDETDLEYQNENYPNVSNGKETNEISELSEDIFQGYSSTKPTERMKISNSNLVMSVSKPPTQNTINELETVLKQRPKLKQTIVYSNGYKELEDNKVKKKTKEERTIPDIPQLPNVFNKFLRNSNSNNENKIENDEEDLTSHT